MQSEFMDGFLTGFLVATCLVILFVINIIDKPPKN